MYNSDKLLSLLSDSSATERIMDSEYLVGIGPHFKEKIRYFIAH